MAAFGYKLMSEEHGPRELVRNACRAEDCGFDFVAISDHYHPWLGTQAHSPLAWTVLGAIAARTQRIGLATAVTCPTMRYHPALVAQFAATLSILSGGRFTLGLGAGENLNEHVIGLGWPPPRVRQEMLGEAVDVIRLLWEGREVSYEGAHVRLDRAKLWDRPDGPLPIAMAAGGPKAARLAAEKAAGLFATEPRRDLIDAWRDDGGDGGTFAEVALCWARDEAEAVCVAHERFRFAALGWKLMAELPGPSNFEAATRWVRPDDVAKQIACGPDPGRHVAAVKKYLDAGFDHIVLVGVGPDQEGFLRFWEHELAPLLRRETSRRETHVSRRDRPRE
jgi:G6PDH family F420-dependent oxidoreductase